MKRDADAPAAPPHRIGVFGGTFDPPHVGHVSAARDVADALHLDRVLWLPARRSPHKPDRPLTSTDVRLEMVRATVRVDARFHVDESELQRPPPSYTVDTVEELRRRHPDAQLYLIIGVDQYRAFDAWRDPDRLRELATLAVMDRDGLPVEVLESEAVSAASVPDLPAGKGARPIVGIPVRRVDVSSTEIRARVAAGLPLEGFVPDEVGRIIERERLYRASS